MKRSFELSVAVASQVLEISGGEGFIFNFSVRKDVVNFIPSGCGKDKPRLPQSLRGRGRGRVPTGGGINAMVGQGSRVPAFYMAGRRRNCVAMAQMNINLQNHMWAGG